MAHCVVPGAEEILDREFRVHEKGFVRLVDYLGGDERIVQAARVSYGEGTKSFRQDKGLINYLLRNEHTSPFEQVILSFHVKMPIFVARQWVRHRTAHLNEISGRYSILKDEFYLPATSDIAPQSDENKQGRDTQAVDPEMATVVSQLFEQGQKTAYDAYTTLLELNIARELARINLPVSTYTEMYWQMDLHNLFHFLKLRMDPHAQKEIRDYAEVIFDITQRVCPIACEAFEEYVAGGVTFSKKEIAALQDKIAGREVTLTGKALERFNAKLEGRKILS